MRCPRCNTQGIRDADQWWCLAHGEYGAPHRATDPSFSDKPLRNRRKEFSHQEDMFILAKIGSGALSFNEVARVLARREVFVEARYYELRGELADGEHDSSDAAEVDDSPDGIDEYGEAV